MNEHRQVAGWGGGGSACGAECACGVAFDGFDTMAEAGAILDSHIADASPKAVGGSPFDLTQALARSIRATRELRGMSQTDLAKAMKAQGFPFHQPTVQRIENGSREVRVPELFALASALDVQPGELLNVELADPTAAMTADVKRAFYSVARAVVTGQMDERISLAWQIFSNSLKGGAA